MSNPSDTAERQLLQADFRELAEELEKRVAERTRELAEANDRLRRERLLSDLIIDGAADGIIVVDTELRYLVWNPAMERINGVRREAVLGKTVFEVEPGFLDHPVGRAWRDAISGKRAEMRDFRFFSRARGAEVVYDADFAPLYDREGGIVGALCILRETTERYRIGRERMLSQLIVENTSEGVIVVDNELRILVWNAGVEGINGRPRSGVLGKSLFEAFPHLADSEVGQAWRDAVAGRASEMRDRRYFSRERSIEIVYDANYTPLYDHSGSIVGAVSIIHETTERHRIEAMLRQSQKLEAVAQLTGGVAHDFNNLLTAVVGSLDMILGQTAESHVADLADTALRSVKRGTQLIQQLLAFASRQALQPVVADLNALLQEIEVLLKRAAGEAIEIAIEDMAGLWRCEVDAAQFEAAVMNLVINARDAMPRGGRVRLQVRNLAPPDIPEDAELRPGEYVAFSVRDTGEGMPPEVMARAFEPFFTTKEIGKGSGLGLSMVYGFARQSGGGVQLESAPGAGTCITLYLPRAAASDASSEAVALAEDLRPGSGSILVVEDDEDVREVSVAMLEGLGYRVLVACDGRAALDMLQRAGQIDLLFTDLVMPNGITGVVLAREAQRIRPGLKVLLTTGYAGAETQAAEEFPIIGKPFRQAELSRVVAELIDPSAPPAGKA